MDTTIGADVEEFVVQGGAVVSVQGMLGGSKEHPLWVEGGNLQEDNVLAEYATVVCSTLEDFKESLSSVRKSMQSKLWAQGATLLPTATHTFPVAYLQRCGTQAVTMGCSEEYRAGDGLLIPPPSPFQGLRTAGGHVHVGYDHPSEQVSVDIVKAMDYMLGLWSLLHDPDTERRVMYGKAGSHRIKAYGVEYRALSNFWSRDTQMIEQVYHRAMWCVNNHHQAHLLNEIMPYSAVTRAIDSYDTQLAIELETGLGALL